MISNWLSPRAISRNRVRVEPKNPKIRHFVCLIFPLPSRKRREISEGSEFDNLIFRFHDYQILEKSEMNACQKMSENIHENPKDFYLRLLSKVWSWFRLGSCLHQVGVDGRTLLDRHNCLTDPIRALYRERTKKDRYWTENEPRKWTVLNLDETVTDDFAQ